jgi:hypothetical protein
MGIGEDLEVGIESVGLVANAGVTVGGTAGGDKANGTIGNLAGLHVVVNYLTDVQRFFRLTYYI